MGTAQYTDEALLLSRDLDQPAAHQPTRPSPGPNPAADGRPAEGPRGLPAAGRPVLDALTTHDAEPPGGLIGPK
jgi:hypothetical protein